MQDKVVRRMLAFFLVIAAVLAAVAVESVRNIDRSIASSDWVNHTHAVILEADGAFSSLHAGEEAMLAFVVTGDPRNKPALREAFSDLTEHLEVAKALTRREPAQHAEILRLETLMDRRADLAREAFAARELGRPDAARALLGADAGAAALAEIRGAVDKLTQEEMDLLGARDTASYRQSRTTRWTVWAGAALDGLLMVVLGWVIADDSAARRRAATALAEANAQLEAKVRERTAELVSANERLTVENLERDWANQALEHQLRYNHLIIDSIDDGVFVLTKSMNISRVNPAVVHWTGWDTTEIINRPFSSLVRLAPPAPGTEKPLVDPLARALAEGHELREQPALVADKRGRETPVRLALFPLRDGNKTIGGVVILQMAGPAAPSAAAKVL